MPITPSCRRRWPTWPARTSNRATALHHDGEQLQARARLLQDELMAKLSEQSNQLLYFLSMLTAVLLPMTIISGLFGMNVGGIPLGRNRTGFLDGLDFRRPPWPSRCSTSCAGSAAAAGCAIQEMLWPRAPASIDQE